MTDAIRSLSNAAAALCIAAGLCACSPDPPDGAEPRGIRPASAMAGSRAVESDAVLDALPDACALLSAGRASDLLGAEVEADTAGSSPHRSVCRYETPAGEASRALTLVISSLQPAIFDYRGMSEDAFVAAVASMVAPGYQDARSVGTEEVPGNGSVMFELADDAVALWVNTGIRHQVPIQQTVNELFVLVKVSGFDHQRAAGLARSAATDVQNDLEVG